MCRFAHVQCPAKFPAYRSTYATRLSSAEGGRGRALAGSSGLTTHSGVLGAAAGRELTHVSIADYSPAFYL
jgi:hypothetical protein